MVVAEPVDLAELIADCAGLPESMRPPAEPVAAPPPESREAPPWEVGDDCVVCVAGLNEYGC